MLTFPSANEPVLSLFFGTVPVLITDLTIALGKILLTNYVVCFTPGWYIIIIYPGYSSLIQAADANGREAGHLPLKNWTSVKELNSEEWVSFFFFLFNTSTP